MNSIDILTHIKDLCAENNVSIYRLSKETGIPTSTLYGLFKSNSYPTIPQINQICDFFCMTLGDFFCNPENHPDNSETNITLYNKISMLSPFERKLVYTYINGLEINKADKQG